MTDNGRVRAVALDLREGFVAPASSPLLRGLSILVGIWALAAGTFWGIGVVYALDELGSGEAGLGIMVALSAVGSLIGTAITRPVVRIGVFPTAIAGIMVSVVAVAAMSPAQLAASGVRVPRPLPGLEVCRPAHAVQRIARSR